MSDSIWLTWQRQASSSLSKAAGWNAARMAERKGEGGGEAWLSGKPSASPSSWLKTHARANKLRSDRLHAPSLKGECKHNTHTHARVCLSSLQVNNLTAACYTTLETAIQSRAQIITLYINILASGKCPPPPTHTHIHIGTHRPDGPKSLKKQTE